MDEKGSRCIRLGATDAMLFQMELSDDKEMGTIFDFSFFLICEKYIFLINILCCSLFILCFCNASFKDGLFLFHFVPLFMLNLLLFLHLHFTEK